MAIERNGISYQNINDASDILGISKYRLRKWIIDNKIPYIKVCQKYMIDTNSTLEMLRNGEVR